MPYSLSEISKRISTPSYVFDFDEFEERCIEIKKIVGNNIGLCYSMKANPFFVERIPQSIDKIEVCSPGEFCICKFYGVEPCDIFYSGLNKNEEDIDEAINYGVHEFTVESKKHLFIINEKALKYNSVVDVFIRISANTQFGIDFSEVKEIIRNRENYLGIRIAGIHYFTGTQKQKAQDIVSELEYLSDVVDTIHNECEYDIEKIEYGTGLYVEYFKNVDDKFEGLKYIGSYLNDFAKKVKLTIEMGRYFSAHAGKYFTRIDDVKTSQGANYVIVNGGINQIVYDGQMRGMKTPSVIHLSDKEDKWAEDSESEYTICGSLCTTNDIIVRSYRLSEPRIGDTLVFNNVGAYSSMEGMSIFLSREIPQIWGVIDNESVLLRDFIDSSEINRRQ